MLGLPAWQCDADGLVVREPSENGSAGGWFRSAPLRAQIDRAAKQWAEQEQPETVSLFQGCWLMPFVHAHGSRRLGMVLAMTLEDDMFDQAPFLLCCRLAGLAIDEAREALGPVVRNSARERSQLELLLRWSHEDLTQAHRDKGTLNEFSQKLADTYEEISTLHALGRSMNSVTNPQQFVAMMGAQLHETVPFGWVSVCFGRHNDVVPELAGRREVAGTIPCSTALSSERIEQLLVKMSGADWDVLLDGREYDLPLLVDSEVVAHPITHDGRVIGALLAGNKGGDDPEVTSMETKFLDAAADFLGIYHENTARYVEQRTLFLGTLQALTASIDAKDRYTCGHSERVAYLARSLALGARLGSETAEQYRIAGLVHDVGKIGIPEAVLCKNGHLTDQEYEQIKRHPVIGYDILKDIPPLAEVLPAVLYHHERWDGTGYPEGLRGDQIPLIGRMFALADTFDAMSSTRSYRPALPRDVVMAEFKRCARTQFDPDMVDLVTHIDLGPYDEMVARHQALSGLAA